MGEELAKATSSGYISFILFYQTELYFHLPLTLQFWISLTVPVPLHGLIDYWLIESGVVPAEVISATTEFNDFIYFGGSLGEKFEIF